jgi:hypothetical protein
MAKVTANQKAFVYLKSGVIALEPGQEYDSTDKVVKHAPNLFVPSAKYQASLGPVVHRAKPAVEAATAEPGTTRAVKKPAAKKPAKKAAKK